MRSHRVSELNNLVTSMYIEKPNLHLLAETLSCYSGLVTLEISFPAPLVRAHSPPVPLDLARLLPSLRVLRFAAEGSEHCHTMLAAVASLPRLLAFIDFRHVHGDSPALRAFLAALPPRVTALRCECCCDQAAPRKRPRGCSESARRLLAA
jgi:hypothetical protein